VRGTFCEAERDDASQGRASFQQKTMPDHKICQNGARY